MIEWVSLTLQLLVLVAVVTRKGAQRLTGDWVLWSFVGFGLSAGMLLEAMPFSDVAAPFSARTAVSMFAGGMAARLMGRGVRAWARGYRDESQGRSTAEARLVHPLIAVGLIISGAAILHTVTSRRHLALEISRTDRSAATGVVRGAEEIRLDAPDDGGRAVLLLHGFLGSPADLGDLPQALHAAGLDVHAIRLPGHGTTPVELDQTDHAQWRQAALDAFDALAADHERVAVVGFSMGGMLAAFTAAERPVDRLVLVNPYSGVAATPRWSPFDTDGVLRFFSPVSRYVIRTRQFVQIRDEAGAERLVAYRTVPLGAGDELQALGSDFADASPLDAITAPTLLLLSEEDNAAPSAHGREVYGPLGDRLPEGQFVVKTFTGSDHILLLDHDADAAIAEVTRWLDTAK